MRVDKRIVLASVVLPAHIFCFATIFTTSTVIKDLSLGYPALLNTFDTLLTSVNGGSSANWASFDAVLKSYHAVGARASLSGTFALLLTSFLGPTFGFLKCYLYCNWTAIVAKSLRFIATEALGVPFSFAQPLVSEAHSARTLGALALHAHVKEGFTSVGAVLGYTNAETGAETHLSQFLTFLIASTLAIRLSVLFEACFRRRYLFILSIAVIQS